MTAGVKLVTAAQMKQAEKNSDRLGVGYYQLMENAGAAAYKAIKERISPQEGMPVLILCGAGNNGGDGFVIARKLKGLGLSPTVALCCGEPNTPDARQMFDRLEGVPVLSLSASPSAVLSAVKQSGAIVDAVYGTGFHGSLGKELRELFWNCSREPQTIRFAVDIPSGVTADTGEADEFSFQADYTLVMDACKPAHIKAQAAPFVGETVVVDIGMAPGSYDGVETAQIIDKELVRSLMPVRQADDHKGVYGKLLAVCGCLSMSGAALMATQAALRTGAGLVTLAGPKAVIAAAAARMPEATFLPLPEAEDGSISKESTELVLEKLQGCTAGLIGCGLSRTVDIQFLVEQVIGGALSQDAANGVLPCSEHEVWSEENVSERELCSGPVRCPLVIDADGLYALSRNMDLLLRTHVPLVLTPHLGEMSRLCGKSIPDIQQNRIAVAREFSAEYAVTLVLKGPNTLVAAPDGRVFVNTTGNPGMARGGSGDILAGMIAALLAQGLSSEAAACCGVYLHGRAGDLAAKRHTMQGMLPTDLLELLPQAFHDTGIA